MKLYYQGKLDLINKPKVAIVGARKMSVRGERLAVQFASQLSEAGWIIISGLARGIDTVAHKQTLAAGGVTIAVLGSGLNRIYPPENETLAKEIAEKGLLLSQYPPDTPPLGENFLGRNRLISGLSRAVVVIEGARRSGTLSTASWAANQGRDVFAVPGSGACDYLIENGATGVQTPKDVLDEIGRISSLSICS